MSDINETVQPEAAFERQSYADQAMDYTDLIRESVFHGEYSPEVIYEGIQEQFTDYVNMEDRTNYVDVFFNQYRGSLHDIDTIDADDHPQERREVLDSIFNDFISFIGDIFETRLMITISPIENGSTNINELESIIRSLYEYFIINARKNFITTISGSIVKRLPKDIQDNKEFLNQCNQLVMEFNPLITTIDTDEFIKLCGNTDLLEAQNSAQWSGNFLKKYSPKLYQNDTLVADIITNVGLLYDIKEDLNNAI